MPWKLNCRCPDTHHLCLHSLDNCISCHMRCLLVQGQPIVALRAYISMAEGRCPLIIGFNAGELIAFNVAMAHAQPHAEELLSARAQAEMAQKERQIQALKAKAKSRSALVPLLMNRVATCKKEVGEEVSSSPYCGLTQNHNNIVTGPDPQDAAHAVTKFESSGARLSEGGVSEASAAIEALLPDLLPDHRYKGSGVSRAACKTLLRPADEAR